MEECPYCFIDLRGSQLPGTDPPQYYSKLMGIEVPGLYDGILYYECPSCQGKMHRFRKGTRERKLAEVYVDDERGFEL